MSKDPLTNELLQDSPWLKNPVAALWLYNMPVIPLPSKQTLSKLPAQEREYLLNWRREIYRTLIGIHPLYRRKVPIPNFQKPDEMIEYLAKLRPLKELLRLQLLVQFLGMFGLGLLGWIIWQQSILSQEVKPIQEALQVFGQDHPGLHYPFVKVDMEFWTPYLEKLSKEKDLHQLVQHQHPFGVILPEYAVGQEFHLSHWVDSLPNSHPVHLQNVDKQSNQLLVMGPLNWAVFTTLINQKEEGGFGMPVHSIGYTDVMLFVNGLHQYSELRDWRLPTQDEWPQIHAQLSISKTDWVWTSSVENTKDVASLCGVLDNQLFCSLVDGHSKSHSQRLYLVKKIQ